MNQFKWAASCGLAMLAVASRMDGVMASEVKADRPPNVILVVVDDLGWTDLSCFGSTYYETSNIDRLCAQGMKFTDAYAACAVCSPTRAAIQTGRYPARVGITDWIRFLGFKGSRTDLDQPAPTNYVGGARSPLLCPPNPFWMDLSEVTLAEVLKERGYVTSHIGKWHLGPDAWYPDRQGYDENIGGCDHGQPPGYFDPYHRDAQRPNIPTLKPRKEGEYLTDREADEAAGFITRHRDKPFFLSLCHYAVHKPIEAKSDIVAKYEVKPKTNHKDPGYAAMVESVDDAMGRILETLDQLKISDRTLIIFTSDNGGLLEPTSNTPLRAGKGHPYEGGIRIPQIIRWPGVVKPGSVCSVPVSSVDFLPTIVEATDAQLPDRVIDGESLVPLLSQKGGLKRDAIFWHFPHYRGGIQPYSLIRQGPWKLIKRYDGTPSELFNLNADLSETHDLAAQQPELVKSLEERLAAWLQATGAKLPIRNPDCIPRAVRAKDGNAQQE
ncbi:MAG: sulfatase [Luteolibacter sp.]